MSHQVTRTSDITAEWPDNGRKKSIKNKIPKSPGTLTPPLNAKAPLSSVPSGTDSEDVSDVDMKKVEDDELPEWNAGSCLFCPLRLEDFDECLGHMQEAHNLSIPREEYLVVDVETILSYCHVVIYQYLECPVCGVQRQSLKPLQAHMRDKGHCGFVLKEGDEFAAFYDFKDGEDGKDEEGVKGKDEGEVRGREKIAGVMKNLEDIGDEQVRLPSGRVVGSKTYRAPRPVKEARTPDVKSLQDGPTPSSSTQPRIISTTLSDASAPQTAALTRADRRSTLTSAALSQLRGADRMQLAHLAPAQQRAFLCTQNKQVAKERRARNWMEGRVKTKGNKFLQARYRADGPGRANG